MYINDIVEGCESFEKIYRNEELRINYSKINRLGCTSYNWSIAVHFFGENIIRIFGKNFVEKNKNKGIILCKNIIYPLKEFFF